jgi:hypothetical protein
MEEILSLIDGSTFERFHSTTNENQGSALNGINNFLQCGAITNGRRVSSYASALVLSTVLRTTSFTTENSDFRIT